MSLFIKINLVLLILSSIYFSCSSIFSFGINTTDSIKGTFFFILKNKIPRKGELVAFHPPKNKKYKYRYFVKYVVGVEGDQITLNNNEIFINGRSLGIVKQKSLTGQILEGIKAKRVEKDRIFVWTPHEDSYDSRYKEINTIQHSSIIGQAYRVF